MSGRLDLGLAAATCGRRGARRENRSGIVGQFGQVVLVKQALAIIHRQAGAVLDREVEEPEVTISSRVEIDGAGTHNAGDSDEDDHGVVPVKAARGLAFGSFRKFAEKLGPGGRHGQAQIGGRKDLGGCYALFFEVEIRHIVSVFSVT